MLDDTESICAAAIIQDSIDRLHIIGRLLPVPMPTSGVRANLPAAVASVAAELIPNVKTKESRHELFPKNLKNEIQTKASFDDDAFKLQKDRSFLEDTLQKTLTEIKCNNTYNILLEAVQIERVKKAEYEAVIKREHVLNLRITNLGKLLAKSKEEKEQLLWRCNDTVTRLSDQLREAKVRTSLEEKYVLSQCNANNFQMKKKLRTAERNITLGKDKVRDKIDQEIRINQAFDGFIATNFDILQQKMEYWMEKHERETEAKDKEIDQLTALKQGVVDRYNQISQLLEKYNAEIELDKRERERLKRQKSANARLSGAVIKIQAWWRGIMVRHFLGSYKKLSKFMKEKRAELAKKKK